MEKPGITDKDWLDLSWKYFQQHAQQRMLYFNYFVIFSTILTTALVSTFQSTFQASHIGIGIGFIQMFLSFIFWKIDQRNRYLTRHSENIIKKIESKNYKSKLSNTGFKLFTEEDENTEKLKILEKKKLFIFRQISHGQSYKVIYLVFFIIGFAGSGCSIIYNVHKKETQNQQVLNIQFNIASLDSLKYKIERREEELSRNIDLLNKISLKLDSINQTHKTRKNANKRSN